MFVNVLILCLLPVCTSCNSNNVILPQKLSIENHLAPGKRENPYASINEVPLPAGYQRVEVSETSFSNWLRFLQLKKDKTVYKFDGKPKANQEAQFAVLNISVGARDLQQCADAVMRLRAEYLFARQNYAAIRFTDNEHKVYRFHPPNDRKNFMRYLQHVFGMCGTASLAKQLKHIPFISIAPGDVIIRGGFPGHAVIVMDVAENKEGKKIYLLAQSYMPAQDIHVLINPVNKNLSPWYEVNDDRVIETPEYNFTRHELRRW